MISNMAKVIDTSAFTIPETDLADLFSAVVKRDTPDLFSPEAHGRVRRREMHWDQIDHMISILCPVSVENHNIYTSWTLTISSRRSKSLRTISCVPAVITLAAPAAIP